MNSGRLIRRGHAAMAATGLGLAITRRLVERMNGEVTVRSVPGRRFGVSRSGCFWSAQPEYNLQTQPGFFPVCRCIVPGIDQVTGTTISSYAGEYGATVEMTAGAGSPA